MKKLNKILLFLSLMALFLLMFSCGSLHDGKKETKKSDCGGIDFENSWFYNWEKTVACGETLEKKNYDALFVQRINFIVGEKYFLANDVSRSKKRFFLSLEGGDCLISKGSSHYLKSMELDSKESEIVDQAQSATCNFNETRMSLFDRYLHIIAAPQSETKGGVLDEFHELYSSVLGSRPAPLFYNIALAAIEEKNYGQAVTLLRNIIDRHPEYEKVLSIMKELEKNDL